MQISRRFTQAQRAAVAASLARCENLEIAKRRIEALQLEALALAVQNATGDDFGYRALRLEVAALLHDSEYAIDRLLSLASSSAQFPVTHAALAVGEVSLKHVREIVEEGSQLHAGSPGGDPTRISVYEVQAVSYAREKPPTRLRPFLKKLVAETLGTDLATRHQQALAQRHVRVANGDDGMADLIAHLPAEDAYAIRDRITRLAKNVITQIVDSQQDTAQHAVADGTPPPGGVGHPPTLDEARADALRDLLLTTNHGDGATTSSESKHLVQAHIHVVIPAEVLTGATAPDAPGAPGSPIVPLVKEVREQSVAPAADSAAAQRATRATGVAELAGYGPIDADTAAQLAAGAQTWERIATSSEGAILAIDRYRPIPEMRRLLQARHRHCRAPGCRVPAHRCDIDHTIDAARGGPTSATNLAHLCRGHHTLKHHSDWTVTQQPDGVLTWVSPTGRVHRDHPPGRVRFPYLEERDVAEA